MNKVLSMALIASLGLSMSSCLKESDSITTANLSTYNMVDNGEGTLGLSVSTTGVELNSSQGTLTTTVSATLAPGLRANFTTGPLKMTTGDDAFYYSAATLPGTGVGVSDFNGKYDTMTNLMAWNYTIDDAKVYSVLSFAYNFSTMNVYDAPGGNLKFSTDNIAFGFVPDVDNKSCTLVLSQFRKAETDVALTSPLSYGGGKDSKVTYTMTADGFTVEGTEASPSEGFTQYDVKDIKGAVTNNGRNARVSFSMGDDTYVVISGSMFYVAKN